MSDRATIAENGFIRGIGPEDAGLRARHEELIREEYARCHPHDCLEALKRRARFSKEDQGVLRDWMALAARRMAIRTARDRR